MLLSDLLVNTFEVIADEVLRAVLVYHRIERLIVLASRSRVVLSSSGLFLCIFCLDQ